MESDEVKIESQVLAGRYQSLAPRRRTKYSFLCPIALDVHPFAECRQISVRGHLGGESRRVIEDRK